MPRRRASPRNWGLGVAGDSPLISTRRLGDLASTLGSSRLPPQSRRETKTHLHAEHVLPRLALEPQQAGVEVPGHGATREIAPQPAVQPLSDTAVRALGVEAGEQEADLAVHPSPAGPDAGLVARRERAGGGPAARVRATARDLLRGGIDVEPEAALWLLV